MNLARGLARSIARPIAGGLVGGEGSGSGLPSGAALVLEASSIVASDSDLISTWSDSSGNGRDATASGDGRPMYKASVGGRPALRFAGDDFMTIVEELLIGNNVTAFFTFAPTSHNLRQTILGQEDTAAAMQFEINGNSSVLARGVIVNGTYVCYPTSLGGPSKELLRETVTYRRNGSGATHSMWLNQFVIEPGAAGADTSSFSGNSTKIIGRRSAAAQYFIGDLFSIIIYTSTLSDDDVGRVHRYLDHPAPAYDFPLTSRSTAIAVSGNSQGVTRNGTDYYVTTSGVIYKLSRTGANFSIVSSSAVSSATTVGRTQITDLDFFGGSIWVCGNNYNTTPKVGWVLELDPADFAVLATHDTEADHAEGCAWKDVGAGDECWVVYNTLAKVSRYNAAFELQGSYDLSLMGPLAFGYQGIAWSGNRIYCPIHRDNAPYGRVDVYEWNGSGFTAIGSLEPPSLLSGQGLCVQPDGSFLFAERLSGAEFRLVEAELA